MTIAGMESPDQDDERIQMGRLFKRWWMLVAALGTALAVVVAVAAPAFAVEPGEESSWNTERVGNGGSLNTPDTYSEAAARTPPTWCRYGGGTTTTSG
jgi:hypothetical protein